MGRIDRDSDVLLKPAAGAGGIPREDWGEVPKDRMNRRDHTVAQPFGGDWIGTSRGGRERRTKRSEVVMRVGTQRRLN
jgi:hypothetical protein